MIVSRLEEFILQAAGVDCRCSPAKVELESRSGKQSTVSQAVEQDAAIKRGALTAPAMSRLLPA